MKTTLHLLCSLVFTAMFLSFTSPKTEMTESQGSLEVHKTEVWEMEKQYWEYVLQNDTVAYKKLWHEQFIGYPSFSDTVSNKTKIATWIPKLHADTSLSFNYRLYLKAVNPVDNVVMVFYDADEFWIDRFGNTTRKETYKFTHVWKKEGGNWLIIGGMAARK